MNEIAVIESRQLLSAADIRAQVNLVQQVMQAVMKEGTHYGKIPGTNKPTLYKPGAEVLCATFRIAPEFHVEDLSTDDAFRYRVTCRGVHQTSGITLAAGMGSASSNEEKYRWRAQICDEEFETTPENRRRVKFKKGQNGVYKVKQIRAEPDDIDNTVLKMACKRAQAAMTLNATAASDIFTQDVEDLPEEVARELGDGSEGAEPRTVTQPRAKSGGNGDAKPDDADTHAASDGQVLWLKNRLSGADGGPTQVECLKYLKRDDFEGMTVAEWKRAKAFVNDPTLAAADAHV